MVCLIGEINKGSKMYRRFLLIFFTLTLCSSVFGRDGDDELLEFRTWSDSKGGFTVEAKVVDFDGKNVSLLRLDNQRTIKVPLEKLSVADRQFVVSFQEKRDKDLRKLRQVREFEMLQESAFSFELFLKKVQPSLKQYASPPPEKSTTVQSKKRKQDEFGEVKRAIENKRFYVFGRVIDVKPVVFRFDANNFIDPDSDQIAAKKAALSKSTFDISLSTPDYRAEFARTFRVNAGEIGENLSTDDFIRLKCLTGVQEKSIGDYPLGFDSSEVICQVSIMTIEPIDARTFQELNISVVKKTPKLLPPKMKVREISREQFKSAFYRMDGALIGGPSMISKEDFSKTFGEPNRRITISAKSTLIFVCSDGQVNLTVAENVEMAVPENIMMVLSVDDF